MIQEDFKRKIRSWELRENQRIMSEAEICRHYGVSRITAVRALNNLAEEAYIKRIPGKGSFVNYHVVELNASKYYSFTEEAMRWGMTPASKTLDQKTIKASQANNADELMDNLFITGEDEVFYIKRVRYADDVVIAVDMSYIPLKRLNESGKKELAGRDFHFIDSVDAKIRMMRNVPTRVNEVFSVAYLSKEDSAYFNVAVNTPVIKIARTTCSNEEILEFHIFLCEGTKFNYNVDLKNVENPSQML